MMKVLLSVLIGCSFGADRSAEVEKQLGEASQKVCESYYAHYVKEHPGAKKFGAEEKNVLTNTCLVRNLGTSRVCARTMIAKIAAYNKRKPKSSEVANKIKTSFQPELQSCLTKSNAKSKQEMTELGKLYLSGRKDLVRAKVDHWSKEAK